MNVNSESLSKRIPFLLGVTRTAGSLNYITDCSALTKIFGPKNYLGGCAMGHLKRWAAYLMEYDFVIIHIIQQDL